MSEEQARYIPEKPEPEITMRDRIAAEVERVDRGATITQGVNGWFLIDNTTGRSMAIGSENYCREKLRELMVDAVMAVIQEDQPATA